MNNNLTNEKNLSKGGSVMKGLKNNLEAIRIKVDDFICDYPYVVGFGMGCACTAAVLFMCNKLYDEGVKNGANIMYLLVKEFNEISKS